MIRRVLLDLDGVLNTFNQYIFQQLGLKEYVESEYPTHCGWDIVSAFNVCAERYGQRQISAGKFWDSITREMWATVPPSAEFHWLLGHAEHLVGKENVCILSSPTLDPDSLAGKLEWINEFCPSHYRRQFLIGPCKQFCAHPDALLIDDSDKNVEAFEKAGGNALLVPRPWNSLNHVPTLNHLNHNFYALSNS